jgi:hypothetical protein
MRSPFKSTRSVPGNTNPLVNKSPGIRPTTP